MAEIVLLASFKIDFNAAFNWYAARSESAATRFTQKGWLTRSNVQHMNPRGST
jgi:hypothetical protein